MPAECVPYTMLVAAAVFAGIAVVPVERLPGVARFLTRWGRR